MTHGIIIITAITYVILLFLSLLSDWRRTPSLHNERKPTVAIHLNRTLRQHASSRKNASALAVATRTQLDYIKIILDQALESALHVYGGHGRLRPRGSFLRDTQGLGELAHSISASNSLSS